MAEKHKAEVENLNASTAIKAYTACQIELDKALEKLIDLQSAGKLDDTVIALSSDHYPYGLTKEEYAELMGVENIDTTFQLYENDFLLWSSSMKEPVVVAKYCSSLDIAPTLSNLFELPYDSRLYMGTDIFAEKSPIIVFQDRSFITDKVKFDAGKNQAELLTKDEVTEEYL